MQRSHHCSLAERLPSFCVLIFRCLGLVESSVRFAWLPCSSRSFFLAFIVFPGTWISFCTSFFHRQCALAIIFFLFSRSSILFAFHRNFLQAVNFSSFFSLPLLLLYLYSYCFSLYFSPNHLFLDDYRTYKITAILIEEKRKKQKSANNYLSTIKVQ